MRYIHTEIFKNYLYMKLCSNQYLTHIFLSVWDTLTIIKVQKERQKRWNKFYKEKNKRTDE